MKREIGPHGLGMPIAIPALAADTGVTDTPDERDESQDAFAKDRNFVTALGRGLELLRCFTPDQSVLGNQDLAIRSGLPKATVSRLTHTLSELGYLRRHQFSGKYQLDIGVLSFGYQLLSNLPIRHVANPFMVELAQHAHAAVAMAGRDRLQMVYLDVVHGQANLTVRRQVGYQMPVHLTSIGRACLGRDPRSRA